MTNQETDRLSDWAKALDSGRIVTFRLGGKDYFIQPENNKGYDYIGLWREEGFPVCMARAFFDVLEGVTAETVAELLNQAGLESLPNQQEESEMPEDDNAKKRCFWCNLKNPLYIAYHDNEWGIPCHDERKLYEMFLLETFQAGLSWECVLNKRENFRKAYDGFDLDTVCSYDDDKLAALMQDAGIIRNRAKLRASIANSRIYKAIVLEFGSFDAYLQKFTGGRTIREPDIRITTSPLSDALSADLKRRGMTFVGSTTIYAFLQAVGVINAHAADCFCSQEQAGGPLDRPAPHGI